jgi:hypothetical protein
MMFSSQEPSFLNCAYPVIKETVPRSSLGYTTNNKYESYPPLMMDGRSITNTWQSISSVNKDLIERNNIQSNWEYRNYLINNAEKVMEYNFLESSNDVGYYKRPIDIPSIQKNTLIGDKYKNPYYFSSILDNKKPKGYSSSDLKEIYLTREQLESRKISPIF